ncbi:MAG: GWxTD domain-containing protein [Candidatus Aminicenantes bacterium]|nr:GWxTD domain-containing protein [Candidatus Aminicenantes bacterium]
MKPAACLLAALLTVSCSSTVPKIDPQDPFYKSFLEKTRLIMTDEEIKIYTSLPDRESKAEFIEEFWKMRDPNPNTPENENKQEFYSRIAFANTWFSDWHTFRGKTIGRGKEADRGWRTDKGRIFIVLGLPDLVNYGDGVWEPMKLYYDHQSRYEAWYYDAMRLVIGFYKTAGGRWRSYDSVLLNEYMNQAKMYMVSRDYQVDVKNPFRAKADYKDGCLEFKVPSTCLNYEEINEELEIEIHIRVNIYRESKKIDTIEESKIFSFKKEDLFDMKHIILKLPYSPEKKGRYLFDALLTDKKSMTFARYRTYVKLNK